MKRLTIFWLCLMGAALRAQPTAGTRPELDKTAAVDMTPAAPGQSAFDSSTASSASQFCLLAGGFAGHDPRPGHRLAHEPMVNRQRVLDNFRPFGVRKPRYLVDQAPTRPGLVRVGF